MTLFKTMDEKRQWRLGCEAMGQRFVQEWQRAGFTPETVRGVEPWIDLPCALRNPHMAALLHAHWFALAAQSGLDVQYIFAAVPMPASAQPAPGPVSGSDIGARLLAECDAQGIDLLPLDYLCSTPLFKHGSNPPQRKEHLNLADMRADFLITLAGQGADVHYILTGQRSANWPPKSAQEAKT